MRFTVGGLRLGLRFCPALSSWQDTGTMVDAPAPQAVAFRLLRHAGYHGYSPYSLL